MVAAANNGKRLFSSSSYTPPGVQVSRIEIYKQGEGAKEEEEGEDGSSGKEARKGAGVERDITLPLCSPYFIQLAVTAASASGNTPAAAAWGSNPGIL